MLSAKRVMAKKRVATKRAEEVTINAPIVDRILAFIIDAFIAYFAIFFPSTWLLQRWFGPVTDPLHLQRMLEADTRLQITLYLFITALTVLTLIYFVIFEYRLKATPGKRLLSLRVAPTDRTRPSIGRIVARNLGVLVFLSISLIIPLLVLIDLLSALWDKERQRFLERWSKTKVIKTAKV
jgi:uncharacterized RDD family membrane protein YckC